MSDVVTITVTEVAATPVSITVSTNDTIDQDVLLPQPETTSPHQVPMLEDGEWTAKNPSQVLVRALAENSQIGTPASGDLIPVLEAATGVIRGLSIANLPGDADQDALNARIPTVQEKEVLAFLAPLQHYTVEAAETPVTPVLGKFYWTASGTAFYCDIAHNKPSTPFTVQLYDSDKKPIFLPIPWEFLTVSEVDVLRVWVDEVALIYVHTGL